MADDTRTIVIESTAGEVAAELARRGIPAGQRVTVTVEPDDWLSRARAFSRPLIEAEGWTDEDIDRLIEEEREAVYRQTLQEDEASRRKPE
jgi:hypothetical protein